jgi:hypothetical protein
MHGPVHAITLALLLDSIDTVGHLHRAPVPFCTPPAILEP